MSKIAYLLVYATHAIVNVRALGVRHLPQDVFKTCGNRSWGETFSKYAWDAFL